MLGKDLLEMITLFGRRDELTVPARTGKWSVDHGLRHRFQHRPRARSGCEWAPGARRR